MWAPRKVAAVRSWHQWCSVPTVGTGGPALGTRVRVSSRAIIPTPTKLRYAGLPHARLWTVMTAAWQDGSNDNSLSEVAHATVLDHSDHTSPGGDVGDRVRRQHPTQARGAGRGQRPHLHHLSAVGRGGERGRVPVHGR